MDTTSITETQWLTVWISMSALFGLIIGSFLNVVIWRVPNNISIIKPGSQCPKCKKEIAWYDNIPVVSYLLLLGKCRNCKSGISFRYPFAEILCASVWAITTWRVGLHLYTLGYLIFFAGLIALSAIDIDTKLLPKKIVYPSGAALVLILSISAIVSHDYHRIRDSVIVGIAYSGFLFIVWFASGGKAMGYGDVRLALFLGFAMGYYGYIVGYMGMLASFAIGSFVGIAIAAITQGGRKMKIPFGPFLAAGTIIAIWLVPQLQEIGQGFNV